MKKHSKRLKQKGLHKLEILETEKTQSRFPKVISFVLKSLDDSKKLILRPTKGYKVEKIFQGLSYAGNHTDREPAKPRIWERRGQTETEYLKSVGSIKPYNVPKEEIDHQEGDFRKKPSSPNSIQTLKMKARLRGEKVTSADIRKRLTESRKG